MWPESYRKFYKIIIMIRILTHLNFCARTYDGHQNTVRRSPHAFVSLLLTAVLFMLIGTSARAVTNADLDSNARAAEANASGFMHAVDKKIVDIDGREFLLRGHAPGGWMIQEPYMMETGDFTSSQHTIREKIESVLSKADTEEFYRRWLANGFTRADVKLLAEMGFNSIRLPLHYNLFTLPFEKEPVKGEQTWLESGFKLVDDVLAWCNEFKIYLILDMHGAPGGQGYDSAISDYDFRKPSLWESEENKTKLVALWTKLAERYANERYIGGYDLLNEPNWAFDGANQNGCDENSNSAIWNLYKRIITAIRAVDPNHMLILEGNCWCNNFNGLPNVRTWDTNLCLEFHKYWTVNDLGSIQFILNLRNTKNLPIWCGESGENSNKWYTDAVRLFEDNGIGWSWWTWKKIGSVTGICTVKAPEGYEALKKYWQSGGTKPSQASARETLFALADAYLLENCTINRAVADALLRQPHSDALVAFADNKVPGVIYAPDYDMGRYGVAYMDLDGVETTHTTGGDYTAWNQGWGYRADGVDIEACTDKQSNGYNVGWTTDGEWMKYTIDVEQTAAYTFMIRYASSNAQTVMGFEVDGAAIVPEVTLSSTGGWTTWKTYMASGVVLTAGKHVLKVSTLSGGVNLASYSFTNPRDLVSVTFKPIAATTSEDGKHIFLSVNRDVVAKPSPSDFTVKVDGVTEKITGVTTGTSPMCIDIALGTTLYRANSVTLSYNGTSIKDAADKALAAFTDMKVTNVSPACAQIPGRINVENYDAQSGLTFEKCEDAGGGAMNFGYTDPGDYVEFLVNIHEYGEYTFQYRTSAMYAGGKFEVQLYPESGVGQKTVVGQYNVDATGGWQTWKTTTTKAKLPKGVYRMRIYIVNKEFNMNWFSFTNPTPIEGIETVTVSHFGVHPNPVRGVAHVDTQEMSGVGTITVYNMAGAQVYRQVHELGGIVDADLSALQHGYYVLQLQTSSKTYSQKIIVE